MLFSCRLFLIYANVRHLHTINFKASLPFSSINIFSYHNHNAFLYIHTDIPFSLLSGKYLRKIWININLLKVIQRCFRITCHKHQISHFEEYRNKSYYCSCNILYPWYPKRQENLIVIWMQMLLMVKSSYKVKSLLPNHMSVVNRFLIFWIEFI